MNANVMNRGTQALQSHMEGTSQMEIRQTRRGWCQELLGCEARTEFKYFINGNQIATSLEDADCCCRLFCSPNHPFKTVVKEMNTEAELVSVDRPFRCGVSGCKCCCYQEAVFTSGGQEIGSIKEDCWFCVPSFTIKSHDDQNMYILHPPTCCGGMCINCCAEGNPCGKGCCKVGFHVFPHDQSNTDGDAPYIGKILKKPKSAMTEIFTEANAFDVDFPEGATADQKGVLIGSSIMLNAMFFENQNEG